jgi:AraC family transcriptional regulator, transcriptional activator of the genes for pyochelin and ferripyochelin receptors
MSFILKNAGDKQVVNKNTMSVSDFNKPELFESEWLKKTFPFGDANMKEWIFDGIRMVYSDWHFHKPVDLEWESNWETVTLYFNLKGAVSIANSAERAHLLNNMQQNMFYGSDRKGVFKTDDLLMQAFRVHFTRDAFLRIAGEGSDNLKAFVDMVANRNASILSVAALPLGTSIQTAINAVLHCKFNNSLKRIFLLSKAMELMVLQADAYAQAQQKPLQHIKSDYDRERIVYAREYLLKHIDSPPSIPELAKIAAINEFKLKKGYKELFGNTIFADLADVRLEQARLSLLENNCPVTDIAYELGYTTVQHFSYVFKKKFGVTPKQVQLRKM